MPFPGLQQLFQWVLCLYSAIPFADHKAANFRERRSSISGHHFGYFHWGSGRNPGRTLAAPPPPGERECDSTAAAKHPCLFPQEDSG